MECPDSQHSVSVKYLYTLKFRDQAAVASDVRTDL